MERLAWIVQADWASSERSLEKEERAEETEEAGICRTGLQSRFGKSALCSSFPHPPTAPHQPPLLQSWHPRNCIELDESPADPVSVGKPPAHLEAGTMPALLPSDFPAHSMCSINICWINEQMKWWTGPEPPGFRVFFSMGGSPAGHEASCCLALCCLFSYLAWTSIFICLCIWS